MKRSIHMEVVYLAGGCLWGVQAFIKNLPGVQSTEVGSQWHNRFFRRAL